MFERERERVEALVAFDQAVDEGFQERARCDEGECGPGDCSGGSYKPSIPLSEGQAS
jgi:hypothetical protein